MHVFSQLFVECVSILIDNGANVDSVCGRQDDTTPLLASIQFNHPECLRILLEKGASIESLSRFNFLSSFPCYLLNFFLKNIFVNIL